MQSAFGTMANRIRVAADSPVVLHALVGRNGALTNGRLRAKVYESIALDVAAQNGCGYRLRLSADSALGRGAGLSDAEIADVRRRNATNPQTEAILGLSGEIVRQRGNIRSDAIVRAKAAAGASNAEVVEVVAETEIDFPLVHASELVEV